MAKILLADDDQLLRDLYQMKFEKSHHDITLVADAQELLEHLKSEKPDVILVDRRLGDTDGITLLSQIRAQDNGATARIIVLTNMEPTHEDMETINKYQPAEYLIKEKIDLNDLVKKVADSAKT